MKIVNVSKNIIRYAQWPFANVEEMDQALIVNWNEKVGEGDPVIFLGDIGLRSIKHLHSICIGVILGFLINFGQGEMTVHLRYTGLHT